MQELRDACVDAGARVAGPGEFTRRAFLEGKIDLAQAEAVADLIDAPSREAARSAVGSLAGGVSPAVRAIAAKAAQVRALIRATADFPGADPRPVHRRRRA